MSNRRKRFYLLAALAVAAVTVSIVAIVRVAPGQAAAGGIVQKIFYYHVGSAMTMYLAFLVGMVGCIGYLKTRQSRWDVLAEASNEVGLVFCTIVLVTGPIWARPVWGTWWRWEPRLVTFLILWFTYAVYALFRRSVPPGEQRARLSAVYGILAFLNIPLVILSTRLWKASQQLHPKRVSLPDGMLLTLGLSFLALALIYLVALQMRFHLGTLERLSQRSANPGSES